MCEKCKRRLRMLVMVFALGSLLFLGTSLFE